MNPRAWLCVWLLILLSTGLPGQEDSLTGEKIILKVNDVFNPQSAYSKARMTILTTSGDKRTFVFESWAKNRGEKTLVRYLEPSRAKGQATLMLNHSDDIWMFFPRTQRVRKLASHAKKQKMQGSDFSYEDLGSGDTFIEDYIALRLEDEKNEGYDCYLLELSRNEKADSSYPRLKIWVIKENFFPLVIDYYDEKDPDRLLKRLVQSDVRQIDGIPTAFKMVMFNQDDSTQTELEILEMRYNLPLEDSLFTERALKK
jgi:outer membrane lipoprotein-sorting protein